MTDGRAAEPAHLSVYRRLRDLILGGDLVPGQPVTIQGLIDLLGVGMTPVREAIRRLTSEGALQEHGNRRVTVPLLTLDQVDELIFARLALEPELARRSTGRLGRVGIAALEATDAALNDAIRRDDLQGYMILNHRFHQDLYAAAEAPVIQPLVDALWLRSAPALRVMCRHFGAENLPDMHAEALSALRRGNAEAVAGAIRADILQGMEGVRAVLAESAQGA